MKAWEIGLLLLGVAGIAGLFVMFLHPSTPAPLQTGQGVINLNGNGQPAIPAGNTAQVLNGLGLSLQGIGNSGLLS